MNCLAQSLPNLNWSVRYTCADTIPDTKAREDGLHQLFVATALFCHRHMPDLSPVFLAWISWLNISVLIGTLAMALFQRKTR